MIHRKFAGLSVGLTLGVLFVGAVPSLGQGPATLPEHVSLSKNVVPTIKVPNSIHLDAMGGQRSPAAMSGACGVAIAPGTSPGGGYLPLSSLGVPTIGHASDDHVYNRDVPPFTFAGKTHTVIGFSTNGYAIVGGFVATADNSIFNQHFPYDARPNNVLAPFWTDLHPGVAGAMRIAVLEDEGDSWIVLDWEGVREWSTPNSNSFQIWIGVNGDSHPVEDVSFAYGLIQGSGDSGYLTVGAENEYGDSGANFYFDGTGTLPSNGTQLRVTTSSCLTTRAVNLSTRMQVQTGDGIGIGGFMISGWAPKHVLIRAIGPSLAGFGVPNALADPVLELRDGYGFIMIENDDWRDDPDQEAAIQASGLPPSNGFESAIDVTLYGGSYTALVRGHDQTSGVALVEVYDLDESVPSGLVNLSTRAFVNGGDNIVIAGFALSNHGGSDQVVVRGLGPSLTAAGVSNALGDPVLELRDGNGGLILANDDWQDDAAQAAILSDAGLAPSHNLESAVAATLPPGLYTGLLRGLNNSTGIGLVEVYDRGP